MSSPLYFAFDLPGPDTTPGTDTVRLPKIIQGVPAEFVVRVRGLDTGLYRDFSTYDEVRMLFVPQQGAKPFLSISSARGQILCGVDHLRIALEAVDTMRVKVPVINRAAINEMRFLHSISLHRDGNEVERFAHGHGYLVAEL